MAGKPASKKKAKISATSTPPKKSGAAAKKTAAASTAVSGKKSAPGRKTGTVKKAPAPTKRTTARKSASGQMAPSRKGVKTPDPRERLATELVGLIPEIDAEGLLFLIRQANVLLHNKRVDELNAEMAKLNKSKMEAHKKAGTTARVGQKVEEITVEIQRSPDGKTYYMIIDNQKHFLTASEMAAVVKLCIKPERKSDAIRFVCEYMQKERDEILMDHGINSGKHPFFEALFYEVRRKFSLNG